MYYFYFKNQFDSEIFPEQLEGGTPHSKEQSREHIGEK
jgi:hypothetical protein